tara:strand:- start:467 stop:1129 length:663 start_codon:yes stop_codon:yes gene_type:complete
MILKFKLLLMTVILLNACSSISNNIAPGYAETFNTFRVLLTGYEDNLISEELVRNIPYASMALKIGNGPKGLIILESVDGDTFTWVSADSIYLVIKGGRIIKTEGLENDLKNTLYPKTGLKDILSGLDPKIVAYYSYENPEINNLKLDLNYKVKDREIVDIFGKEKELIHLVEEIRNSTYGWNFTNHYWVDESYYVWKSIQTVNPKIPPFELTVTKKPSL